MDIKTLLQSLLDHKVQFLVIGAWALPAHGYQRMTGDVDIFIKPTRENAERTIQALREIGYKVVKDVPATVFLKKKILLRQYILQTDIHPFVAGATYETVWRNRLRTTIKGLNVFVPSLEDLMRMKKAAGRPRDKEDLRVLRKIQEKKKNR
jgi:predicted nucleotidyltransferase